MAAASPQGAAVETPREVDCPLCGYRFPAREACPAGCPMAAGCRSLCCPSCHYTFIEDDSAVLRWLRRLTRRGRS